MSFRKVFDKQIQEEKIEAQKYQEEFVFFQRQTRLLEIDLKELQDRYEQTLKKNEELAESKTVLEQQIERDRNQLNATIENEARTQRELELLKTKLRKVEHENQTVLKEKEDLRTEMNRKFFKEIFCLTQLL